MNPSRATSYRTALWFVTGGSVLTAYNVAQDYADPHQALIHGGLTLLGVLVPALVGIGIGWRRDHGHVI